MSQLPFAEPPWRATPTATTTIHDQQAVLAAGVARALAATPRRRAPRRPGPRVRRRRRRERLRAPHLGRRRRQRGGRALSTGFDYVALGHLHRPQRAGADAVRYAGSLLKYSFAEHDHVKSVSVVEIGAPGSADGDAGAAGRARVTVETVPLAPPRDVRVVDGLLADLLAAGSRRPGGRRLHPGRRARHAAPSSTRWASCARSTPTRSPSSGPSSSASTTRASGPPTSSSAATPSSSPTSSRTSPASRSPRRRRPPSRATLDELAGRGIGRRRREAAARPHAGLRALTPASRQLDFAELGGSRLLPHHRPHRLRQDHRARRHGLRPLRRHQRRRARRARHAQPARGARPAHRGRVRLRRRRRALPHRAEPATGAPAQARRGHHHAPAGGHGSGDSRRLPTASRRPTDRWPTAGPTSPGRPRASSAFAASSSARSSCSPRAASRSSSRPSRRTRRRSSPTLFDTAFYARVEIALKARAAALVRDHERLAIERQSDLESGRRRRRRRARDAAHGERRRARRRGRRRSGARRRAGGGAEGAERGRRPSPRGSPTSSAHGARRASLAAEAGRTAQLRAELDLARLAAPLTVDDEAVGERAREAETREDELAAARERLAVRESREGRRRCQSRGRGSSRAGARRGRGARASAQGPRARGRGRRRRSPTHSVRRSSDATTAAAEESARERRGNARRRDARRHGATPPGCARGRGRRGRPRGRRRSGSRDRPAAPRCSRRCPGAATKPRRPSPTSRASLRTRTHGTAARSITSASLKTTGTRDRRPGLPRRWKKARPARSAVRPSTPRPRRPAHAPRPATTSSGPRATPSTGCSPSETRRDATSPRPSAVTSRPLAEREQLAKDARRGRRLHSRAVRRACSRRGRRERRGGGGTSGAPRHRSGRPRRPRGVATRPARAPRPRKPRAPSVGPRPRRSPPRWPNGGAASPPSSPTLPRWPRPSPPPRRERRTLDEALGAAREAAQAAAIALETARADARHAETLFEEAAQASRRADGALRRAPRRAGLRGGGRVARRPA